MRVCSLLAGQFSDEFTLGVLDGDVGDVDLVEAL